MGSPVPMRRLNDEPDELRDFLLTVRRALLLIVKYIERRYGV